MSSTCSLVPSRPTPSLVLKFAKIAMPSELQMSEGGLNPVFGEGYSTNTYSVFND